MTTLRIDIWRLAIAQHADGLARAVETDMGPIRARHATVATTDDALAVTIDTRDPDHTTVAWTATVWLAQLWAPGQLLEPVDVALAVTIGPKTTTTDAAGMRAISGGVGREKWAPTVGGARGGLRVV